MHSARLSYLVTALAVLASLLTLGGCPGDDPPPATCQPQCTNRTCGDDGCGGSCGSCEADQTCTPQGFCIGGEVCEGVTLTGCCTGDGTTLKYCKNGELQTLDCEGFLCGFREEAGVYTCGFEADPSPDAAKPYLCPQESCPADTCDGQECGFDCGQSCGECATGQFCAGGTCQACSCDGRQCGTDECGNACGDCAGGDKCDEATGQCVPDLCQGISFEGCCTGDGKLRYCDQGELLTFGCGLKGTCGWRDGDFGFDCTLDGALPPAGTPFLCPGETCASGTPCANRECGNECGLACGTCEAGEFCDDFTGQCNACSCDGKTCGDDGCGNSCGECADGQVCDRDTQQCKADQCGTVSSFGCCNADETAVDCVNGELVETNCKEFGLTCGWNGINYGCTYAQFGAPGNVPGNPPYQCPGQGCAFTCDDVECGVACGQECGDGQTDPCGEGQWCDGTTCKPCTCAGAECGGDGCGNLCGVCASDEICDFYFGSCNKDGCNFTDFVGCCDGLIQHTCGTLFPSAVLCANSCGWDAAEGGYRCGGEGEDPSGTYSKTCQAVVFP